MALKELQIKALKPKERLYRIADSDGLCLEVAPSGGKRWRFRYRFCGQAKMISLGTYPTVSLKDARLARDDAKRTLSAGVDPSSQAQTPRSVTFKSIAEEWLEAMRPTWVPAHARKVEAWLKTNVFPFIGSYPPDEVPPAELRRALARMEERGARESARKVCNYCSMVFRYAAATGRGKHDIASAMKQTLIAPEKGNFATMTDAPAIAQLLRDIHIYNGSAVTCLALRLMPLVFVRTIELRRARWCDIDWDARLWNFPRQHMKTKVQHIVPLSRQALEILRELRLFAPGDLCFPGVRQSDRPMSEATMLRALRSLGYSGEEMTVHGFRHMASTLLNEAGWNRDAIERQLSHSDKDSIRGTYNHAEYLPLRTQMMQAWADYLDALREWQPGTPLPGLPVCP
ncbi:tyrosine-type recombinase/integrase [Nitratidesulfovibrio vulgaris]|uniref:tyrosine-type recombinase/integrase n=1 Tax=Nitratidesulfovibrio vulgaris TaxID=881 RepID=UPI002301527E|nr:integrase arm-type DNA-binding domain-containing protein [Nitratidesulfovibrio vulgaris]WCB45287.1 tyrosine-type recombinase/integrase [Nitratidesulfovibrio vulgaris]